MCSALGFACIASFLPLVLLPSVLWRCCLGGRKGTWPEKKLSGGIPAWLSVWDEVQICIWPSWCHCHSLSLASVKSKLVLVPAHPGNPRQSPEAVNGCVLVFSRRFTQGSKGLKYTVDGFSSSSYLHRTWCWLHFPCSARDGRPADLPRVSVITVKSCDIIAKAGRQPGITAEIGREEKTASGSGRTYARRSLTSVVITSPLLGKCKVRDSGVRVGGRGFKPPPDRIHGNIFVSQIIYYIYLLWNRTWSTNSKI